MYPTITHLDIDPIERRYGSIWLKYVLDANLDQHCINSLVGPKSAKISTRNLRGNLWGGGGLRDVVLNEAHSELFYLCAVVPYEGYDQSKNFHLAFSAAPGETLHYEWPGLRITIKDARRLFITPNHIDPNNPHARDRAYNKCRNWQFASALAAGVFQNAAKQPTLFDDL